MSNETSGWLETNLQDPVFRRELASETLIEHFLDSLDLEMNRRNMSRADLARKLGCTRANVTQIFSRQRNMRVSTMASFAFALGLEVDLTLREATHMKPIDRELLGKSTGQKTKITQPWGRRKGSTNQRASNMGAFLA